MTRVLTAAVLIAGLFFTIWVLPSWVTLVLAAVAAAIAAAELDALSGVQRGHVSATSFSPWLLGTAAACFCVAFAVVPQVGVPHSVYVGLMISMIAVGVGLVARRLGRAPETAATARGLVPRNPVFLLMAPAYIGAPLGAMSKIQAVYGPPVFTVFFLLIAVSDSAQYYTGRAFGRRKLAPSISPAKTVEGALGGLAAAALVGAFLGSHWIPGVSPMSGAGLGLVLGAIGIIGDLFESFLKRRVGVKDSSSLIPGHGGLLDRIDSWLFAAPIYYVFLRYFA